jgi:hypothetical protein
MNVKTDLQFIVVDTEAKQEAIVCVPPQMSAYRLPEGYAITIALAQLVGQPVKSWRPEARFSYGRIKAVHFSVWQAPDPLLPIPLVGTYGPKFKQTMRDFALHLMQWHPYSDQWAWSNVGNILLEDVIRSAYRLNLLPDERRCFEDCLRFALAYPTA